MEPLSPRTQLGEMTVEELKAYNGWDPEKPLLIAIEGHIYEASRALAKLSFEEEIFTSDISSLSSSKLDNLRDWENKFMNKYVKVGTIKRTEIVTDGPVASPIKNISSMVQQEEEEGFECLIGITSLESSANDFVMFLILWIFYLWLVRSNFSNPKVLAFQSK
ncbi:hypothetical protein NE237_023482 [Protea cynaroides]|uniref:Uncharacterized protein n=1 Tax=Protea cynaroides TaxID=273540 RepID=A0A9Q0K6M8_9MAGN|nr:hypothetical protein NE237_023482 [Protea cynaroides]